MQAYNVLGVVDLIRYCARLDLGFGDHVLACPPQLGEGVLPAAIRRLAADRLRRFVGGDEHDGASRDIVRQSYRDAAMRLAADLDAVDDAGAAEWDAFMQFTNDLDRSRGQAKTEACPELWRLLAQSGRPWRGDLLYLR